jgi:hypothetical protein
MAAVVTSLAPNTGPIAGGTPVTITGTGFTGATAVTFGGIAATNIVDVSDTSITANTPAHAAGAADVVVTAPTGAGTLAAGFTYLGVPVVSSISPNRGPPAGGTSSTIHGLSFTGATAVQFGGQPATNVVVVSDTSITATAPAHALGPVTVSVTTPDGTGVSGAEFFTYWAGSTAVFPAFTPIVPPPTFGLPPPPVFPPATGGHTPVPVPVGPLVGPAVAAAAVPPSVAGITQPVIGGSHPIVFPGFSTTFPNPPVSVQTTPPPPNMIVTTPPIVLNGWGPHAPGGTLLGAKGNGNAVSIHHGDAEFPERSAGAVLQPANPDQLHQSRSPKGGSFQRVPPRRPSRNHD